MSFNLLPNEIVLHLCLKLNIVDFIHLSMASQRYYEFRQQVFEYKTRLVFVFPNDRVSRRLMKPSVQRCMEQSSEQRTTDLPVEEIAEFNLNLTDENFSEKAKYFNIFPNITQVIVIGNELDYRLQRSMRLLLQQFPQLRMLKMIFYRSLFSQMISLLGEINLPNLRHLSLFARCTYKYTTEELIFNVKYPVQECKQTLLQLDELYIRSNLKGVKYILKLFSKKPNKLQRLGLYFDTIETCLDSLSRMKSSLNVTHLTMHSSSDDYDSLNPEQLQLISRQFPVVQHFIPDTLISNWKEKLIIDKFNNNQSNH